MVVPPAGGCSSPRQVVVTGRTNQGGYVGTYDTATVDVTVTPDVSGYTVGGMADLWRPTGLIHVVGRERDVVVSAEADGQPMTVVVPRWHGWHGEIE